ncbi:MAG: tetratricopeptide repeat protein, partial [Nannocystaceae bacterium]|nr:tetratricopeptide repeat protein [Nannocystaceae bacterium]
MSARWPSSARLVQLAVAASLFAGPSLASAAETADDERAILAYHDRGADARPVLAQVVADGSDNPRVHLYLALAERDRGELVRAIDILECALARPGDLERELRIELAVTASWQGDTQAAVSHYNDILVKWPGDAVAQVGRARMLSWQGRHAKSRAALKTVLDGDPGNLEAWSTLAANETADFRVKAARAAYAAMLELDADNEEAVRGLRSLDASQRLRVSAFGGYLNVGGDQHAGVGETDLAFDVRAFLTALAGYSASVYRFDDPTTTGHLSQQHVGRAGLVFNIRRRVYLGSEYRLLAARDTSHHSVAISGALV